MSCVMQDAALEGILLDVAACPMYDSGYDTDIAAVDIVSALSCDELGASTGSVWKVRDGVSDPHVCAASRCVPGVNAVHGVL